MGKKYLLAVPNFSEGRSTGIINKVVEAVKAVDSVKIVGVEPEANFNRTVLTFVCEPQHCEEAMLKMAKIVYDNVDMSVHKGDHPRIGALDTMPIFPLENMTLDEVKALAEELGQKLHDEFKVPVYFSGLNARTEYKKSNTNIRKGQYEGLKALLEDPNHPDYETRKPDLSVDGKLDARMGACTVTSDAEGLTAYNVYLESENLEFAKEIAKIVKGSEEGWSTIKSVGFKDEGHIGTAVSMNVFDCKATPLAMLRDFIDKKAKERGTKVIATGLVGPVKRQYIVDSAKAYGYSEFDGDYDSLIKCLADNMGLEGFQKTSIIEYHIN
ncbi:MULTISPECIES: glutamate formimidoyltransferase [Sporomusa]|uniref:glutamate formimidoyltransferase n=1 Tax=Sporomusa TaxID=2375 RepID=UPI00202ECBB0|nr:glutamate formimidoyltransferase [Sporomusa sphaeroides]MCM0757451.1 glutamate formimidoyltransferase [Sporomusa sphaeroides DSM 2875]